MADMLEKFDEEKSLKDNDAKGWPTMRIEDFIEHVLTNHVGEQKALIAFVNLLECYDMLVWDGVVDASPIETSELIEIFKQNMDDDYDDIRAILLDKHRYSIHRDSVALAFKKAGKLEFPWLTLDGNLSYLSCDEFLGIDYDLLNSPNDLRAKTDDYQDALNQDSWTAREAICWLKGINPHWCRGDIKKRFVREEDLVKRAIKAGKLTNENSSPKEWIAWAISKKCSLPDNLLSLCTQTEPETQTEAVEDVYAQRKKGFERWKLSSGIDIQSLKIETIFQQVKQTDKSLWDIAFTSFQRDFWPKYSKEIGLTKKSGRPARR